MTTIYVIIYTNIIILMLLTCHSEKIRYIATEHPQVTDFNKKYISFANLSSKRYGRRDPFYYVDMHLEFIYEFHNNITVHFYFYEFLSNRYKRGFVEMHMKFCDLIWKDKFFGTAMRQGKFNQPCPYPPGLYSMFNMTIPIKNIPHNFPFTKGRIYANLTGTFSKEFIGWGYIDMEIREAHTNVRNWVDGEH